MITEDDILDSLRRHAGIDAAQTGEASMRAGVRRAMANCAQVGRLLDPQSTEWQALLETMLVPETWFFRNLEAFEALAEWIRNTWLAGGKRRCLRVLCLPCATGEEAYSLAMALLEAGLDASDFRIQAGDISPTALAMARAGNFRRNSFRTGFSEDRHGRFFEPTADPAVRRVSRQVRDCVEFSLINLVDSTTPLPAADVVFCRNALIYFSTATQMEVLKRFYHHLPDDGLLFLGPVEPPVALQCGFFPAGFPMAFACTKVAPPAEKPAWTPKPRAATEPKPTLVRRVVPVVAEQKLPAKPKRAPQIASPIPPAEPKPVEIFLSRARSLADAGEVAAAADWLADAPPGAVLHADFFALRGLVHESLGDHTQAEADFRKAVYLNPSHTEALSHLSLLLELQGRTDAAATLRRRARQLPPSAS